MDDICDKRHLCSATGMDSKSTTHKYSMVTEEAFVSEARTG